MYEPNSPPPTPVWMVTTWRASSPESAEKETSHLITGCVTLPGTAMCSRMAMDCRGRPKCQHSTVLEYLPLMFADT